MKYPDFAKCQIRSIYLAKEMKKEGYNPKVLYGIFRPTAPRKRWDERWQQCTQEEFVHFWIAFSVRYYDFSCFQFGESAPIYTSANDKRYEAIGELNYETGEKTNFGQYVIEWESYTTEEGYPLLRLVPIFI